MTRQHPGVRGFLHGKPRPNTDDDPAILTDDPHRPARMPRPMTSTIVIPYVRVPAEESRPVEWDPKVDVTLIGAHGGEMGPTPAFVDSGADRTYIPKEWAPLLGYDLADARQVRQGHRNGPKNTVWLLQEPMNAIVAGWGIQLEPFFDDVRDYPMLGRDFFQSFRVEFDDRSRVLRLTPQPKRAKTWA